MFTWGSKYLLSISGLAWVAGLVYGITSGGSAVGVISFGYKGGVGDHTGFTIFMFLAAATLFLTVVTVINRDGDAEELSALVGADDVLPVTAPATSSLWGPVVGFGLGCLAVGFALSSAFWIFGIVILSVAGIQWLVLAWSDRATGDPEVNSAIRARLIGPLEIPMLGSLIIAGIVVGISRVLLAVSELGAIVVAIVVATVVFVVAIGLVKGKAGRNLVSGVVAVGAIMVLAGGIIGAVAGERDFHHGEVESGEHSE